MTVEKTKDDCFRICEPGFEDAEGDVVIVTESVALKATCPYCGHENVQDIGSFCWEELWYGQEDVVCDRCDRQFHVPSESVVYDVQC